MILYHSIGSNWIVRRIASAILGIGLVSVLALLAPSPAEASCQQRLQDMLAGLGSMEIDELITSQQRVEREPTCSSLAKLQSRRLLALAHVQIAQARMVERNESLIQQEPLLQQSLRYARTWQSLSMLGDIKMELRDYTQASLFYQDALVLIQEPQETPTVPETQSIERIIQLASEAGLLADKYSIAPTTRSGTVGGLGATNVRGISISRVPLPITFETATAVFTLEGRQAATDLARWVSEQRPDSISIVGHTDERGTHEYNMGLSIQRARAVEQFLRNQGFTGQIETRGKGETEPFQPLDPSRYSQDELWQLDRRVEIIR